MDKLASDSTTPTLRFPEFDDGGAWQHETLRSLASPVKDKATGGDNEDTLTLSGEMGLVPQGDYFGKQISGENVSRYIKIFRDDFVYNDRTTKASKFGSIKRLTSTGGGIVSPIYKCFRFKRGQNPDFWDYYFEAQTHEAQLGELVNEGARAGRFNISIEKFLSIDVWKPSSPEQERIAECLASIDTLIEAETEKLDALKEHKQGLMQQLFPADGDSLPKLRFSEFNDDWKETKLGSLAIFSKGKGVAKKDIDPEGSTYCIRYGELYTTYGAIIDEPVSRTSVSKNELVLSRGGEVIVPASGEDANDIATAAVVLRPGIALGGDLNIITSPLDGAFLAYYLSGARKRAIAEMAQGNTVVHLYPSQLETLSLSIPSGPEQRKIAGCLQATDELILKQSEWIGQLVEHKQGLLQRLFPALDEVEG